MQLKFMHETTDLTYHSIRFDTGLQILYKAFRHFLISNTKKTF